MNEVRLFTPGPTPVPERVRLAGAQPMIHHRSPEFSAVLTTVRKKLNWLMNSREAVVFASSGSGAMEAAVASLFDKGSEVVIVESGKFGERWVELAQHYELQANVLSVEWGKAVTCKEVLRAVKPSTKGILIQACESSTGVFHPIQEIGKGLGDRKDLLFVVDGITAVGVHDIDMERDRIDVMVGGSQKALMCPPGLSSVGLGDRALACLEERKPRSYYFSLQREVKSQSKGDTGFTPAISLMRSLHASLGMMEEEGKEALFARHKKMSNMARAAFTEDGMKLFNRDQDATWGITVVEAPSNVNVDTWLKDLKNKEGLWLAGGQGELKGKIFRVAHMGACRENDLLEAIETIEGSLAEKLPKAAQRAGYRKAKGLA